MKAYELIDSPEKWVNHSSLGFELEQIKSIRELFASDQALFANGRAFGMMEASCQRQVQRSVHGNYAEVPARSTIRWRGRVIKPNDFRCRNHHRKGITVLLPQPSGEFGGHLVQDAPKR